MRWGSVRAVPASASAAIHASLSLRSWVLLLLAAGASLAVLMLTSVHHEARRMAVMLVLAPVLEECVFRAGLQEALLQCRACRPGMANVITAVTFGLVHAVVRADALAFSVVLPALLIGAVYQRSARLRHAVVLHAAMNALWLLGWEMAILPA